MSDLQLSTKPGTRNSKPETINKKSRSERSGFVSTDVRLFLVLGLQLYATVLRAAFGGFIVGNRAGVAITGGFHALRVDAF